MLQTASTAFKSNIWISFLFKLGGGGGKEGGDNTTKINQT